MKTTALRDLVANRLDRQWAAWAADHPNLAAVIDRTHLIEMMVEHLAADAGFVAAMRAADLDETTLTAAARLLEQVERLIGRTLMI